MKYLNEDSSDWVLKGGWTKKMEGGCWLILSQNGSS